MSCLGIRHHLTTAYHPQLNGMMERTHRQLKDVLRARLAGDNWLAHLPYVLLSLRATPKEDSNLSSAELVYRTPILLPGQLQQGSEPLPSSFAGADHCTLLWIPTKHLLSTMTDLTSTDSSRSLSLNWLLYRLLEPYSLKVTVGVTQQW